MANAEGDVNPRGWVLHACKPCRIWQSDSEWQLPKPVDPRVETRTAFPRSVLRLTRFRRGGARREGSNMTKFDISPSKIESISR
jgi:hypothetical protein